MKMKRVVPLAMTALLLGGTAAFADSLPTNQSQISEQQEESFVKVTGKVGAIEQRGDLTYYINDDKENPFRVTTHNSNNVYDIHGKTITLQEGDEFTAYMYANQPMILIYPPQYTAAAIVKKSAGGASEMGTFNEKLVNEVNSLKLNLSEETQIVNTAGESVKSFKSGDALVFYTMTTRSIPAQTTPSKMIVFSGQVMDDAADKLDAVVGKDVKIVNGKKMVPLRLVAEHFGYQVESTGNGALVLKDTLIYTITRGDKTYGHNGVPLMFSDAPALLEKHKTYVEYDFALKLASN